MKNFLESVVRMKALWIFLAVVVVGAAVLTLF